MNEKKINQFMLIWLPLLIVLSIAATVLLTLNIGKDVMLLNEPIARLKNNELANQCIESAKKLPYLVMQRNSDDIRITAGIGQGVSSQVIFAGISVLLAACEGYDLDYFCAGGGCPAKNKIVANFTLNEFYK